MRFLLALLLGLGLTSGVARAQAIQPGNCDIGRADGTLDVNQVQATVYTTGTLFYGPGGEHEYYVPQQSRLSPVYASSVWIAGFVGEDLRVAGATYGQGGTNNDYFEFWPGPLNEDGTLPNPNDCSQFDKIWSVSRQQIVDFEATGTAAEDLANWPADLGAPVIDGDGDSTNYNLAGGDRPDIIGDQSLWYVLNDVGNLHRTTDSDPIGLEVRIQAFSFARDNALGQTTFYRYEIEYFGNEPLTDTFLSVWSDPDLGNAADDFVGVDVDISMGFTYNADEVDDGSYGSPPPAVGYDFFQGPLVQDSLGNDSRLGVSSFMYFVNGDANRGDPGSAEGYYRIMRGFWSDGTPLTAFGNGYNTQGDVTKFAFPGDPVTREFWSEENIGNGRAQASDRRFVISTGPFTINPGDTQEIVFGIVYARGNSRLSSVTALRAADVFAQNAYDLDFDLPIPASAPPECGDPSNPAASRLPGSGTCFYASELNGEVVLNWGYAPTDAAYLGNYESQGYEFEGFNLYRYPTGEFSRNQRQLVATFDKANDITTLQNVFFDPEVGDNVPVLAAQGTDSGLAYSYQAANLTNYTDYYYGLTTYLVDPTAEQERVIESAPTFLTVRPSRVDAAQGGAETQTEFNTVLEPEEVSVTGGGTLTARVVDPAQVTGDDYEVRFFRPVEADSVREDLIAYDIVNATTGEVLFNGQEYFNRTGLSSPELDDVVAVEGLSFSIAGAIPQLLGVEEIAPSGATRSLICSVSISGQTGTPYPAYIAGAQGVGICTGGELGRLDWQGGVEAITPTDIEIRYTEPENGQLIFNRQWDEADPAEAFMQGWISADAAEVVDGATVLTNPQQNVSGDGVPRLPFTVWEVDPDGTERQVMASVLDDNGDLFYGPSSGLLSSTSELASAAYERIYVRRALYDEAAMLADPAAAYEAYFGSPSTFGRFIEIPYAQRGPDGLVFPPPINVVTPGYTVRARTSKPNLPGDVYRFSTSGFEPLVDQGLAQEDVDRIGVVPNPYFGVSEYESGNTERVARFTNLPQRATIRIFTISGTLIRTLTKDNAQRSFDWNLQTENGLPVASGLYLIHIELPDSGLERVIKFGVINRQTQIDIL